MLKKLNLSKISVLLYWLLFLVLAGLFFTNDFGLVDIHKSSIITAVGIDCTEQEVAVTAEIAEPQPSQSGENIKYTRVQGSGLTIADAMNEINSKTGFYPKLQFCKLILVGENCIDNQLFRVLGCFYRKNYSELTALVALCKGKASDMLAKHSAVSDMTSEAIRQALSDEIEKSANANSVNLKDIAMAEFSHSGACFMPYVETNKPGTSAEGGNGDSVGGEQGGEQSGGEQGGSGGGEQGGSGGGESSGGAGSGGTKSGANGGEEVEFTAHKTAYFSDGLYRGILDEKQSFALAMLKSEIRLAVLPCDSDGVHYTLGLKDVKSGISLKIENGTPKVTLSVSASAQIQGARVKVEPADTMTDDRVDEKLLKSAEEELKKRIDSLYTTIKENDSDVLELKDKLFKYENRYFEAFKDNIMKLSEVDLKVKIISVN